jgi:TolB-like protein/Flp pilus assembly protein TadD
MSSPDTATAKRRFRFDTFEFDTVTGELQRGGTRILLQPQPATLLSLLLSPPDELVTRERIRLALWGDDTTVDFELGMNRCVRQLRSALRDSGDTPRYIETLPRRGYRFIAPVSAQADEPLPPAETPMARTPAVAEARPSIVVLPFTNFSADPADEYFSDGLTEEITNGLVRIGGLKVIARTSAFAFKGKNQDVREIAETLGVSMVLEGSVRRSGGRVRITSQLIRAADGTHLSSKRYDRELTDVFETQDEISADIAAQLKVRLVLRPHPTNNIEAYEVFLEGRSHWHKFSSAGFAKALECYQRAAAIDPDYGAPHAGIAGCYFGMCVNQTGSPRRLLPKALAAARRAVELDGSDGEAHSALAEIVGALHYDWTSVGRHLHRAAELNPASHRIRMSAAYSYLLPQGRVAEALTQLDPVVEEDPLLPLGHSLRAGVLYHGEDFAAVEKPALRALALDPNLPHALQVLSWAYGFQGRHEEALARSNQLAKVRPGSFSAMSTMGFAYALAGKCEAALAVVDELKNRSDCAEMCATGPAFIYAILDEREAAFDWLERAVESHDPRILWLKCQPKVRHLQTDPRMENLLRKMNLAAIDCGHR